MPMGEGKGGGKRGAGKKGNHAQRVSFSTPDSQPSRTRNPPTHGAQDGSEAKEKTDKGSEGSQPCQKSRPLGALLRKERERPCKRSSEPHQTCAGRWAEEEKAGSGGGTEKEGSQPRQDRHAPMGNRRDMKRGERSGEQGQPCTAVHHFHAQQAAWRPAPSDAKPI